MSAPLNLAGQKFGRLHVLARHYPEPTGRTQWLCVCECRNVIVAKGSNLRNGHTRSCGCLVKDRVSESARTHGLSKHPLFRIWRGMKGRCRDKTQPVYFGRVKVCDRWMHGEGDLSGFECFLKDMGPRPSLKHSIDRIDNDGGYDPSNCRWATASEQRLNQRPHPHHDVCQAGHLKSGANLYVRPNGKRECVQCKQEQLRRCRAKRVPELETVRG